MLWILVAALVCLPQQQQGFYFYLWSFGDVQLWGEMMLLGPRRCWCTATMVSTVLVFLVLWGLRQSSPGPSPGWILRGFHFGSDTFTSVWHLVLNTSLMIMSMLISSALPSLDLSESTIVEPTLSSLQLYWRCLTSLPDLHPVDFSMDGTGQSQYPTCDTSFLKSQKWGTSQVTIFQMRTLSMQASE